MPVWRVAEPVHGNRKVHVLADSDALIIRGMLAVIVSLLDQRTPQEIISYKPRFLEETNLKQQISTDRFQGINSVITTIQQYAKLHAGEE